jgi:hypothetical protein
LIGEFTAPDVELDTCAKYTLVSLSADAIDKLCGDALAGEEVVCCVVRPMRCGVSLRACVYVKEHRSEAIQCVGVNACSDARLLRDAHDCVWLAD